ncbi:coiled-coil domain-containing protein 93 isoform X2 [Cephus cinctus]|uniref:Coiled-coil domain-containing protein 93 n=1 Tax=Cephus cinctus TaxID=211228 RepID=A0AAJ7W5H7_CEPCN|nr:coiled-coil domain-containing protein 93 isoform X2 [Cephus cinctus]
MFSNVPRKFLKNSDSAEVDVREDEEQAIKFQEIIDLLVAAGYFRARIKGLSNFDKWLVKRSMEKREETGDLVRSFAISQFDKNYSFLEDHDKVIEKKTIIPYIKSAKKAFEPRRCFKRKDPPLSDEIDQVRSTLLEYGSLAITSVLSKTSTLQGVSNSNAKEQEENSDDLMKSMSIADDNISRLSASAVGSIVGMQAQEIAEVTKQYASLNVGAEENSMSTLIGAIAALDKQKTNLKSREQKLKKEKDALLEKVSETIERLNKVRTEERSVQDAFQAMKDMETDENRSIIQNLEQLLLVHDNMKDQEHKFREQCKADLNVFQEMVSQVESSELREEEMHTVEYEEQKEIVNKLRLQLAKKNRAIASLTRQLDDVPGRSELNQYQRRFLELYNQVSAKHKETKQYYTLYNTLDDTKLYLSKELTLLNSIQDNYNEAMSSTSGKEQFLKQFEAIVAGVDKNKAKVERRCADEKIRRDALSQQLVTLIEQQRRYVVAVQQLTTECRKNEALLAQLRGP